MLGDPFAEFDDMPPREGWDIAQVCMHGHLITSSYRTSPQFAETFCSKRGAATITSCPACNQPVRGDYDMPGVILSPDTRVENFCYHCGKPYPWHEEKLGAAKEFAAEVELPDDERKLLVKSFGTLPPTTHLRRQASCALSGL